MGSKCLSFRVVRKLIAVSTVAMLSTAIALQVALPQQASANEADTTAPSSSLTPSQSQDHAAESDTTKSGISSSGTGDTSSNGSLDSDTSDGHRHETGSDSADPADPSDKNMINGSASSPTAPDNSQNDASTGESGSDAGSTDEALETVTVNDGIMKRSNIPYAAPWSTSQTQKMDLYAPAGDSTSASSKKTTSLGKKPVVVFVHGGAWINGNKSFLDGRMPLVSTLLQSGYLVASIDYRPATEAPWPAQINDCKSAVRFIRANASKYGIDPNQIVMFGESAGAHLAQLMGTTNGTRRFIDSQDGNGTNVSSDVKAVISDFGISDVDAWGKLSGDDVSTAIKAKDLLFGVGQGEQYTAEQAQEASPLTYVTSDAAPMLLVHGLNDGTVSYEQTVMMENALTAAGADVSTWYPADGPHSSAAVFCTNITAQRRYLDFLSRVLSTAQTNNTNQTVPVHRFYQSSKYTHLFSAQANETLVLKQSWTGWRDEGVAFRVLPDEVKKSKSNDSQPASVVVKRMYNAADDDYIYTSDANEIDVLVRSGWIEETSFRTVRTGGIPVYRLCNPQVNRHMLVSDSAEKSRLVAQGWNIEGVAFHALAPNGLSSK